LLSSSERKVLWVLGVIYLLYLPPVTNLVNRVEPFVLGIPFFVFWQAFSILVASALLAYAYSVVSREGE